MHSPTTARLPASATRTPRWLAVSLLALLAACAQKTATQQSSPGAAALSAPDACQKLAGLAIPAAAVGEPTTGATVKSAELVAADAPDNANGEYCKVLGAIHPVDVNAPDINFEVNLPSSWNHKTLQFGGGGLNGVLVTGLGPYARQPQTEANALKRGYVTLGSDSGHQSAIAFDGHFYLNEEALENYGHQQIKKTHDVALQLVQARYAAKPDHNYLIGASQGGHEGFDAVQRYPEDYDGVVAGYPAHNVVMLHLSAWHYAKGLQAAHGKAWINPAKARMFVAAVYARCDELDGAKDGIISNVSACEARNAPLKLLNKDNPVRCAGGADSGDTCLSDAQIGALNAIDVPYAVGFKVFADDAASAQFPKWTPFAGSTFRDGGLDILGGDGPTKALQYAPGAATLGLAIARDPKLNVYEHFDPKAFEARIKDLAARISANSVDLDRYQKHGGKLIFFHGMADDFISPYSSIQYYGRLKARYDDAALGAFVRFYTIPGMGHVTGVFSARMPLLDALENWVEHGVAPGELVATDANKDSAGRTRPVCPYPAWPHYDGKGDLNAAASFSCGT